MTNREIQQRIRREWLAAGKTRCSRLEPQPGRSPSAVDYFPSFCWSCGSYIEETGKGRGWRHVATDSTH